MTKCRILIFILLALVIYKNADAGLVSGSIEGSVTAAGKPLPGVAVSLTGGISIKTRTDQDGYYKFTEVRNGRYKLVPELDGYIFYPAGREITLMLLDESGISFKAYASDADVIKKSVKRAVDFLISKQSPGGYWMGSFESDTSFNAYYIILMHYVDMVDAARQKKAVRLILKEENSDGGWSAYPGGPGMVHIAVLNYMALRLAGYTADDPVLKKARNFILSRGGAETANQFIQTMLALFGQVPWNKMMRFDTDILNYEALLFKVGYLHTGIIPLSIIYENYYKKTMPGNSGIREIFVNDPWKGVYEEEPSKGCCHKRGIKWIKSRQEADGNWCGVFLNTMQCMMALKSTGNPKYIPLIEKGMGGVRAFQRETGDIIRQQFSQPPVMDSAYALQALLASGVASDHPSIKKCVDYLVSKQSLIDGDWHYNSPHLEPGGWGFEHHNLWFPDIDCTAMVLDAFALLDQATLDEIDKSVQSGINWLAGMQNRDGGFSAWDRNTFKPPRLINYLMDMDWIYFDQSNEDITARAALALSDFNYSKRKGNNGAVQRAVKFLESRQDRDGRWYGRWLINYTYCTGQVLQSLIASGEDPSRVYIRNAVKWLKKVQRPDGGWGETPESYSDPEKVSASKSTVLQTAYALIGLISAGEASGPRVRKGIEFLVSMQRADGSWSDEEYLGTGVPNFFYCRYELLSATKALYALSLYLKNIEK